MQKALFEWPQREKKLKCNQFTSLDLGNGGNNALPKDLADLFWLLSLSISINWFDGTDCYHPTREA